MSCGNGGARPGRYGGAASTVDCCGDVVSERQPEPTGQSYFFLDLFMHAVPFRFPSPPGCSLSVPWCLNLRSSGSCYSSLAVPDTSRPCAMSFGASADHVAACPRSRVLRAREGPLERTPLGDVLCRVPAPWVCAGLWQHLDGWLWDVSLCRVALRAAATCPIMSEPSFRDAEVLAGPPVGHEGPGQLPQNVPYAMFELSTLEVLWG